MASVVESIVQPDENAIKAHLETLFAPLRDEYPGGLVELRYGAERPVTSAYFNLRADGCADAAAFAAGRSRAGDTVYVGVNPRKPSTNLRGSASDTDVEIAAWHFADIDSADALNGLGRKLRALPVTYSVDTGQTPHRRPHLYWLLDEPVRNMAAWTERQRGIAQALGGDAVINPSRIMRLAGTVNFPPPHKLQRGYRVEVVTLKTEFEDEREPVTPDEIAGAFPLPDAPVYSAGHDFNGAARQVGQGETTLSAMARTRVMDLLSSCRAGDQWHNNMVRLTAHLAGKGRTTSEILALAEHITLPGFSVEQTRREMAIALVGARTKYNFAEPDDEAVESEEAAREAADSIFEMLDIDELENMPPIEWLVEEVIPEEGLVVIYGDPEAGKTFTAIDLCLRLAHSMDWHGTAAKPAGVFYVAGEGARGIGQRVKGWRKKHGMEGVDAPFLLVPVAVQLLDPKEHAKLLRTIEAAAARAGYRIGIVVIDTVSRALAGQDENGQESMSALVLACDVVRTRFRCAVIGIHHAGKDKEKGMRGSSVLLGAVDTSIKIEKVTETVTKVIVEKQKDAEKIAPFHMHMEKITWANGLEKEQSTLVPFRSEAPIETKETLSNEQIGKAFGIIADAWGAGKPLSTSPNTREQGRYAAAVLADRLGAKESIVKPMLTSWLQNDCLEIVEFDKHSKAKGLRVINPIVRNG